MDPNKMTTFMGFDMDQRSRQMWIDLIVASVVIAFILLPSFCLKVEGKLLKRKDSD